MQRLKFYIFLIRYKCSKRVREHYKFGSLIFRNFRIGCGKKFLYADDILSDHEIFIFKN